MGTLRQFFIHDAIESILIDTVVYLSERDSHHVANVLRLTPGTRLEVIILASNLSCECTLSFVDGKRSAVIINATNAIAHKKPAVDTVLVSLCKAKKNEFVIEKATELGVSRIVFTRTVNSEFKFHSDNDKAKKHERWKLIAESAAKQSKRKSLPELILTNSLEEALENCPAETSRFVCSLEADAIEFRNLAPVTAPATLAIGPEGDFSPEEYERFKQHAFTPLSLGEEVLRAETAVIASIASIRAISKA